MEAKRSTQRRSMLSRFGMIAAVAEMFRTAKENGNELPSNIALPDNGSYGYHFGGQRFRRRKTNRHKFHKRAKLKARAKMRAA